MIFRRKIKSTEVIEKEKLQLWNDYQTYLKVEGSHELKQYLTLKERVESIPFIEKKKEIEGLKFKGSPEFHLLKKYNKIKNNRRLVNYLELKSSGEFSRFIEIEKSGVIQRLNELERYMKAQFSAEKKSFKKRKKSDKEGKLVWEETEAYKKQREYDDLKTSSDIIFYKRFVKSAAYKNFLKVGDSSMLNQYENMTAEIASEKFIIRKAYLEDEKRYEKTDDFKLLHEYNVLNSNPDIQLYMKYNDTDAFKFFREWTLTFEEDFSNLEKNRWSYITPIAQNGPAQNFSVSSQLQYYNGADNFDTENGILTLETKREKVEGLLWDEKFGFIPKIFDYASGVIHSLNSFKQQYGHFEIKLKTSKVKGVVSSVTLVDESEELAIRLYSSEGGKVAGGLITTDHKDKNYRKISIKNPLKGYIIISLDWSPERVEWSINERYAGSISENTPHVPLGLRIETEVLKDTINLPHRIDVDWIKCYTRN